MTGLAIGSIFAGCRIEAIAGRGGMGVVYKATQVALDRPVALKAVAPDVALEDAFQARFKHEARLAASIDHPNIVPVYEAGEIDEQLYLVMRWVDGVDLRALIDRGPSLEPERVARLVAQVASALAAAHAKGLMHRDVKPANVLVASVDDAEHAYLTDFGIARLEHATSGLTHTGMMIGTIDYMAPERIEGGSGDARSDIYALGCLLYEMLTGRPPYVRENEGARLYAHLSAEIPSATESRPDVPVELSDVARQAMAKRPEERFQSAGEMARAALAAVGAPTTQPVAAKSAPAPTAEAAAETALAKTRPAADTLDTVPPRRRPPRGVLAGGALLVAAAIALVVLVSGGGGDGASSRSTVPSGEPIAVPGNPDGLGTGAGTVWAAAAKGGAVSRIDAETGKQLGDPIPVGADPDSVAVSDDAVWVTNNDGDSVSRIDPGSGQVVKEIPIGHTPEGIALDADGAPWVALIDDGGVRRIDPASNKPGPLVKTGDEPYAVLVDGETVWVANRADGKVAHFDLPDGPVSTVDVGGRPRGLAVDGSSLWVVDLEDRLVELDRQSGSKKNEIELKGEPREITAGEGALWVTLHRTSQLARVDPSSRGVTTRSVPSGPTGVAIEAGAVWVASNDASTVTPFVP